jgi:hypothetical protein
MMNLCPDDKNSIMANKHGMILVLVIVFSFVLSAIGMAVIYLHSLEEMASIRDVKATRALNMADAGTERARAWLYWFEQYHNNLSSTTIIKLPEQHTGQGFGGNNIGIFHPVNVAQPVILESGPSPYTQGSYQVSIVGDSGNYTDTHEAHGFYTIISSGMAGDMVKVVQTRFELDERNDDPHYTHIRERSRTELPLSRRVLP